MSVSQPDCAHRRWRRRPDDRADPGRTWSFGHTAGTTKCRSRSIGAGAGMLPPGNPANAVPLKPDCDRTVIRVAEICCRPADRTGIDIGYHVCGAIEVSSRRRRRNFSGSAKMAGRKNSSRTLSADESRHHVADLDEQFREWRPSARLCAGAKSPVSPGAEGRVSASRCGNSGKCQELEFRLTQIASLRSDRRTNAAVREDLLYCRGLDSSYVAAAGIFNSRQTRARSDRTASTARSAISMCHRIGRRYLVPRPDGLILIGSTEEDAGFAKLRRPKASPDCWSSQSHLCHRSPWEVVRTWAGLRQDHPMNCLCWGRSRDSPMRLSVQDISIRTTDVARYGNNSCRSAAGSDTGDFSGRSDAQIGFREIE